MGRLYLCLYLEHIIAVPYLFLTLTRNYAYMSDEYIRQEATEWRCSGAVAVTVMKMRDHLKHIDKGNRREGVAKA
jgi:hypothetical protein